MVLNHSALISSIRKKKSYLCVGLDTDIDKIPKHLHASDDPIFEFNKQIINATLPYTVAYKPNLAFYEAMGSKGWESLQKTMAYIPADVFTIADAKRGDIGNTAEMYAKTFFETFNFDAVTLSPYMGRDSVAPFLRYEDKFVILLALTSNSSASDFQHLVVGGNPLYMEVIKRSSKWGNASNMMYVVGATKSESISAIRKIVPDHFLLVPGVGAQGGSLEDVAAAGLNNSAGLLVNSSRGIIYASSGEDFTTAAAAEAQKLQSAMELSLR